MHEDGADEALAIDALPVGRRQALLWRVLDEVRWSCTPPSTWLVGAAVNFALSLLWLVAVPLTGRRHSDWAIVIGTYFAVFILADVTTTNVLGADALRVRVSLLRGVPLLQILVVKNLALLVIVGLPTLLVTAVVTVTSEDGYRLVLTLPGVAFPILTWLGVGNIISVTLPVAVISLRQRWQRRHDIRATTRWLAHLALPYALLYLVDPIGDLPATIIGHLPALPRTAQTRGVVLTLTGLILWALGTAIALGIVRIHRIRIR